MQKLRLTPPVGGSCRWSLMVQPSCDQTLSSKKGEPVLNRMDVPHRGLPPVFDVFELGFHSILKGSLRHHPNSVRILVISTHVLSGSPGRFGMCKRAPPRSVAR